ncbi:hypothetical protein GWK47_003759 [Chionoecetes opilio]|uniref:C2H2-type domain-containing protein n=1 Tax=Chionoecetes opilio TaxID=41210 RepID=A0A8J4YJL2_CHIOP|nr:hypothetical protein GWK47_003759 [Chionoecetes opilio]
MTALYPVLQMQRHYLHPRCGFCRTTFYTRMKYERHVASISHLRVRTANIDNQEGNKRQEDQPQEEEAVDLDLANFMTLDSVGDDDDEGEGSEHEEITGGVDAAEAQDEETAGADDDLEDISGQSDLDGDTQEKDTNGHKARPGKTWWRRRT